MHKGSSSKPRTAYTHFGGLPHSRSLTVLAQVAQRKEHNIMPHRLQMYQSLGAGDLADVRVQRDGDDVLRELRARPLW